MLNCAVLLGGKELLWCLPSKEIREMERQKCYLRHTILRARWCLLRERGIGKGIAQVLAVAGAAIVLNALTSRYVESTAAEIATTTGRRVMPLLADVTKAEEVHESLSTPQRRRRCAV